MDPATKPFVSVGITSPSEVLEFSEDSVDYKLDEELLQQLIGGIEKAIEWSVKLAQEDIEGTKQALVIDRSHMTGQTKFLDISTVALISENNPKRRFRLSFSWQYGMERGPENPKLDPLFRHAYLSIEGAKNLLAILKDPKVKDEIYASRQLQGEKIKKKEADQKRIDSILSDSKASPPPK